MPQDVAKEAPDAFAPQRASPELVYPASIAFLLGRCAGTMAAQEISDYLSLFLSQVPLLDVRAPVEFSRGAFPGAINLPLLSDEERRRIGIRYKQSGQDAAIKLGHELVCGTVKEARVAAWVAFKERHPDALLYCFRGGLRSRTVQGWMSDAGIDIPRIKGGYKGMRRFLIDSIDRCAGTREFLILGGRTGSGKTQLLHALDNAVDLEGLARHRGSAFGRTPRPQPTQIDFENELAIDLLRLMQRHAQGKIVLEDESRTIGSNSLPLSLFESMRRCPLLLLEESLACRVDTILQDYIIDYWQHLRHQCEPAAEQAFRDYLLGSLQRIRRRLGAQRFGEIQDLMELALNRQQTGDFSPHQAWIRELLVSYYDPMYDYQLSKKQERIVFRGNRSQILDWMKQHA